MSNTQHNEVSLSDFVLAFLSHWFWTGINEGIIRDGECWLSRPNGEFRATCCTTPWMYRLLSAATLTGETECPWSESLEGDLVWLLKRQPRGRDARSRVGWMLIESLIRLSGDRDYRSRLETVPIAQAFDSVWQQVEPFI